MYQCKKKKGSKLLNQKHLLVNGKKLGCRVARLKKVWKQECFDTVVKKKEFPEYFDTNGTAQYVGIRISR